METLEQLIEEKSQLQKKLRTVQKMINDIETERLNEVRLKKGYNHGSAIPKQSPQFNPPR